jgi:hypothetical protein
MTVAKLTTEALDELSDDALALIAVEWADEGARFLHGATLAKFELEKRMEQRGATRLNTENWTGVLKSAGYTHTIEHDAEMAMALRDVIGDSVDELWCRPPQPARAWDHRALNDLHKLGGPAAEIIDQYRRSTPKRKQLELKAKSE